MASVIETALAEALEQATMVKLPNKDKVIMTFIYADKPTQVMKVERYIENMNILFDISINDLSFWTRSEITKEVTQFFYDAKNKEYKLKESEYTRTANNNKEFFDSLTKEKSC